MILEVIHEHMVLFKTILLGILLVGSDETGALIGLADEIHQDPVFVLGPRL